MHVEQATTSPSVGGSDDVTEESVSQVDLRWSSEEDEVLKPANKQPMKPSRSLLERSCVSESSV